MTIWTDTEATDALRQATEHVQRQRIKDAGWRAQYADMTARAVKAEAYVERLREENRSLMQTIRRVLRAAPVEER